MKANIGLLCKKSKKFRKLYNIDNRTDWERIGDAGKGLGKLYIATYLCVVIVIIYAMIVEDSFSLLCQLQ